MATQVLVDAYTTISFIQSLMKSTVPNEIDCFNWFQQDLNHTLRSGLTLPNFEQRTEANQLSLVAVLLCNQ